MSYTVWSETKTIAGIVIEISHAEDSDIARVKIKGVYPTICNIDRLEKDNFIKELSAVIEKYRI